MVTLYFAPSNERPNCSHVFARRRRELTHYLRFLHREGDSIGGTLDNYQEAYSDQMGTGKIVPKEAHSTLRAMQLVSSSPVGLTEHGSFAAQTFESGRNDIAQDVITQHFRAFPTIAYTIDIIREADGTISPAEVVDQLRRWSSAESSFEENSIRNCLNLLDDFDVVIFEDSVATVQERDMATLEAVMYAIYLLAGRSGSVSATELSEHLPQLIHCSPTGAESLVKRARKQYSVFSFRTQGDRGRQDPYGGVFDIQIGETSAEDLQASLL